MLGLSKATWNVCQLGAVLFFNFSSYFTLSSLSQTIIDSIAETEGISKHAGYYSAFVIYLVFTIGHFVSTPLVEIITPKYSLLIGLIGYFTFEVAFLLMNEYFLYISAACAGFSGSLLWTAQFDYLAQNCQANTLDRNASLLWGLTQMSMIAGGSYLLVLYRFQTGTEFDMPLIRLVIFSCVACTGISFAITLFLQKPVYKAERYPIPYFKHLSEIAKISLDRNMLFLLSTFLYTGMELSFLAAVFPTMVSFTKTLGNTRDLNAIATIFVGIGNLVGCSLLSSLGPRVREIGRKKMVFFAAIVHLACFCLAFLMFPDESPLKPTSESGYFQSRAYIVLVCGILLGLGDTVFNQQCYTIISDIYEHDKRVEAFAVYRFYQSAASCVVMFYAAHATLKTHIALLVSFCLMATVTFFMIRVPEKSEISPPVVEEDENAREHDAFLASSS